MAQRHIPPNPANVTIWYEYFSEENPALRHELRALMDSGVRFNEQLNSRLYETYFGLTTERTAVASAGAKLNARMETIGSDLERAGKEAGEYCRRLVSISDGGAMAKSQENVLRLVQSLLAETHDIIATNQVLEGQLIEAASEIDDLKKHLEAVREEAMSDPLTGLVNRKYLDVRLTEQAELAASSNRDLCVILADIDDFKSFNDTYGHQVGDVVLKVVARAIEESIRGGDILARYGGEEFCIVLPNTGLNGGAAVAENVRNSIARKTLKSGTDDREFGIVTASFGVADHKPGEAIGDLIARADAALYAAKRGGRNQVVMKNHAVETT
jgi:diguanylate cyclase